VRAVADLVLTVAGADLVLAGADLVLTGADLVLTGADLVLTVADLTLVLALAVFLAVIVPGIHNCGAFARVRLAELRALASFVGYARGASLRMLAALFGRVGTCRGCLRGT
jgi:hypothetical protein